MKRFAILLLLLIPSLASAQGIGYLRKEVSPDGGGVTPYPLVTVCTSGADLKTLPCTPKVSIYTDDSLVTPKANPFRGGADGSIEFHVAPGTYIVSITAPYSPGYSFKIVLTTAAGGGLVTSVTASSPVTSTGGTTPDIGCAGCVQGTTGANQIPVGTGAAQTVSSSSNFTFAPGGGDFFLNMGGGNNFLHTNPGLNITRLGATASNTDGQVSLRVGLIDMLVANITGSVPTVALFGGTATPGGRTVGLGTDCTTGTTSGLFCWQIAAAAGTPNPIVPPIVTGCPGCVYTTDGGNPQLTSWQPNTSGTNFGTPPTSPNITFLACDQPSGGVANNGFCWPGTPGRTVTIASATIGATDRAGCVLLTFSGAVAVAAPALGADPYAHNFEFCVMAAAGAVPTITPTTSQISGNDGTLAASLALPASSTAFCKGLDNANYRCTVVAQLATQYSQWLPCDGKGIGDGLNAIPAGTYLMSTCRNTTGVTVTITGIKCFTDNSGSSTLNVAGNTLGALLTGAVTCSSSYASGTQSANVLLTANDYIKFTFVADGTSKQTDWVITGTF